MKGISYVRLHVSEKTTVYLEVFEIYKHCANVLQMKIIYSIVLSWIILIIGKKPVR